MMNRTELRTRLSSASGYVVLSTMIGIAATVLLVQAQPMSGIHGDLTYAIFGLPVFAVAYALFYTRPSIGSLTLFGFFAVCSTLINWPTMGGGKVCDADFETTIRVYAVYYPHRTLMLLSAMLIGYALVLSIFAFVAQRRAEHAARPPTG